MSYVTSAIIHVGYAPRELHDLICDGPPDPREQSFKKLDDKYCGGNKCMESDVYACAFNYYGGSDIEDWFKSLPWDKYSSAVLTWFEGGEFAGVVTTMGGAEWLS